MVYIHVPFCRSFCTYCDFYSEIVCKGRDNGAFESYTSCLLEEISRRKEEIAGTSSIPTIYIGGGTPSVLPLSFFRRVVDALGSVACGDSGKISEFTVEVNPDDIARNGESYVRGLVELGVNRISMGVQSLDDGVLGWMNRRHDAATAEKAFSILRKCGVPNISVDIIFGLSILGDSALEDTIDRILALRPEHLSAYPLSVEEGSALARLIDEGRCVEADEESCRRQYELICRKLSGAGYHHYEISNWAVPGFEAVHNSAYWTRAPYVGLGPAAHSLRGRDLRSWNSDSLSGWTSSFERLSEKEIEEERIMLGLRTDRGVDGFRIEEKDFFIADSIIAEHL
ncbi:MAG: radical SAM family heme chaperone HemW [Bacteroidales bacterium]|nr:radical SAM family heme chaperone HemW [Bacteroidales bacterium]